MIPAPFNFKINSTLPVSDAFRAIRIEDFLSAAAYTKKLPYGRNMDKNNPLSVLKDERGTCSTKHALLKCLAEENNQPSVKLMLGIFRMNAVNTAAVAGRLSMNNLTYIPEPHNYLVIDGQYHDYTRAESSPGDFLCDLELEIDIGTDQIGDHKVSFYRSFLEDWLERMQIKNMTLDRLWAIREGCICDLTEK
jgi:hypothetical protein